MRSRSSRARRPTGELGAHPAAGPRGRAVRARRHAAVQGRDRRRRRGRSAAHDFYRPGAPAGLRRDPRPLRPRRAGRRRHGLRRAAQARRPRPGRRRALPAHADLARCRPPPTPATTRRSSREGDPAPAGRGRHQDRAARLRDRRAATSTTSSTRARPRSTTSPSAARQRGLLPPRQIMRADPRRDRGDRPPRRRDGRRADRLRRPRRADQRPAPGPDDHRRRPAGHRQGARAGHAAAHARPAGPRWARSRSATSCSAPTAGRRRWSRPPRS